MSGPEGFKPTAPAAETTTSNEELRRFLEERVIKPESLPLIEELMAVNKSTLINCMHNFFSHYKDDATLPALRSSAERSIDPAEKKVYELFYTFVSDYDQYAGRHLVAVLERL